MVFKSWALESDRRALLFSSSIFPAVWHQANYLTSLWFSFCICQVGWYRHWGQITGQAYKAQGPGKAVMVNWWNTPQAFFQANARVLTVPLLSPSGPVLTSPSSAFAVPYRMTHCTSQLQGQHSLVPRPVWDLVGLILHSSCEWPQSWLALSGVWRTLIHAPSSLGIIGHKAKPPGHEANQVQERRGSVWIPQVPDPYGAGSADADHHHPKLPLGLKHTGSRWGLQMVQAHTYNV